MPKCFFLSIFDNNRPSPLFFNFNVICFGMISDCICKRFRFFNYSSKLHHEWGFLQVRNSLVKHCRSCNICLRRNFFSPLMLLFPLYFIQTLNLFSFFCSDCCLLKRLFFSAVLFFSLPIHFTQEPDHFTVDCQVAYFFSVTASKVYVICFLHGLYWC